MKRRFFAPAVPAMALGLALATPAPAQSAPPSPPAAAAPAYAGDPAFQAALDQARQSDDPEHGRFEHWKQASDLAKGQCMDCLRHVISGEFAARNWKDAVAYSLQMDANAVGPEDRFYAEASAGKALLHNENGKGVPPAAQLSQSEGYFRSAIALHPRAYSLIYTEGEILATLGRNDEAKSMFERFLRFAPETDTRRERVQQFVANPQLASRNAAAGGDAAAETAQDSPASPPSATQATAAPIVRSAPAPSPAVVAATNPQPATPEPAYMSDPKFQKAMEAAQEKHLQSDEKLARWKKAAKLSGNQCVECLRQVVKLQVSAQQWKDAAGTAREMAAVATAPNDKGYAQAMLGSSLMYFNDGAPKPDQLREADASFTAALAISPRSKEVIYSEGRVLAMLGRDADARAMFQRYLDRVGEADKYRTRAEHFVENPHLASFPMAPPFTVTTAEGEQINLDEQVGKVVLLDFWATWCGPCKETLPVIHSIAKKFAGQPLVVVSISSDANDIAWKEFIAKNDMFWAQYRDANHALSNAYGVSAIPRFFTIDSDGVLQSVKVGSGADIEGDLKKLIKRASEAEKKKALSSDKAGAE